MFIIDVMQLEKTKRILFEIEGVLCKQVTSVFAAE